MHKSAKVGFSFLALLAVAFCTKVTVWEEDRDTEPGESGRVNPRVTSCLPNSAFDQYPILVIPYGPITEWRLDGSTVNITLPILAAAHSTAALAASERGNVHVRLTKVENLLHGDNSSPSPCAPSLKQTCFWPWSARAGVSHVEQSNTSAYSGVITFARYTEKDDAYAHAHEDLFRYFREPDAAIHSVCDSQPSTMERYSNLLGASVTEIKDDLCVYVSLYSVHYLVRVTTPKSKTRRSAAKRRSISLQAASRNANVSESDALDCNAADDWLRGASDESGVLHKAFRFILRIDTLLVKRNSRFAINDINAEPLNSDGHLKFMVNEFFAVQQRAKVRSDSDVAGESNQVTAVSSTSTCRPFGCRALAPEQCVRTLVFADLNSSTSITKRSFLWTNALVEFDDINWKPTTTRTPTTTTTAGVKVDVGFVGSNNAASSSSISTHVLRSIFSATLMRSAIARLTT